MTIETDMRAVARIMKQRELPMKAQWKLVGGFLAIIGLGLGATMLYAQTIQPQHQQMVPVVFK
jgi:hypothetical protein